MRISGVPGALQGYCGNDSRISVIPFHLTAVASRVRPLTSSGMRKGCAEGSEAYPACCRVELRTQEAERGMNSEEAERLVWAAQTIFATGCELRVLACAQLDHTVNLVMHRCRGRLSAIHVLGCHR